MTFSLVGRCEATGMVGVVMTSSSPAVASRCAYVRAGVGAAATQNLTDPRLGPRLLDAMAAGHPAPAAIGKVVTVAPEMEYRQLSAVDNRGGTAAFTGSEALGIFAHRIGDGCVAAGNLLASDAVLDAMVSAFAGAGAGATQHLGSRLLAALEAGLEAGGEAGPVSSAGLLVADEVPWPVVDLRVDADPAPIPALRRLWELWEPQMGDYVKRALDPMSAPAYGVPGDEDARSADGEGMTT